MVEKMRDLGLSISMEEVIAESGGGVVARPHMAKALVRKGIVPTIRDAFHLYLSEGAAGYVPRERLEPAEASDLIHSAGGIAVIAHPVTLKLDPAELVPEFARLRDAGMDGVECYYSQFSAEQSEQFLAAANAVGLVPSGGSDFHGEARPDVRLGQVVDGRPAPYTVLEGLKQAYARRFGAAVK